MDDALALISTRKTPQSEKADARQEKNEAGGFAFRLDDVGRLHRFLMTGTQGGTFYIGERELTKDNAAVVFRMARPTARAWSPRSSRCPRLAAPPSRTPRSSRWPLPRPTAPTTPAGAALAAIPRVCRTGTHLFLFAKYVELFPAGSGPAHRRRWLVREQADRPAHLPGGQVLAAHRPDPPRPAPPVPPCRRG